jgi:F-type H+-transporting ATPase subunit b
MHFLGNLGIDLSLLFAQVVNFLILLFLLTKFVYKPLLKRIEADEASLEHAARAHAALKKREEEVEIERKKQLEQTKLQAESLIREAEEIAQSIREKAQVETTKEKEAVLAQIKERLSEVDRYGAN